MPYHFYAVLFIAVSGFIIQALWPENQALSPSPIDTLDLQQKSTSFNLAAVGQPHQFRDQYYRWKTIKNQSQTQQKIQISLTPVNTHGQTHQQGSVDINFDTSSLSVQLITDNTQPLNVWVSQNGKLTPTQQPNEQLILLGTLKTVQTLKNNKTKLSLTADLSILMQRQFKIGQIIVAPKSSRHLDQMIMAGSPNVFQRLYATELQTLRSPQNAFTLSDLLIPVAHADEATGFPDVFTDLVSQGEALFFNETFNGNGRTCSSCHPAVNNFTLDKPFIASLRDDDPLFVAEFVPALMYGHAENLNEAGQPQRFENPTLMREFGLIVENVDGLGDLDQRFTMRSVTHNIGMSVSVDAPTADSAPPRQRTGWSGDGAPMDTIAGIATSGRVRDFMLGAIVQHYPKTLNRSFTGDNPDFRAPTLAELDAMEAFLFSIGRQEELDLQAGSERELILRDAGAEAGKILFRDGIPEGNRTCDLCHSNAGANVIAESNNGNRNFDTGVEAFLRNRMDDPEFTVIGEPRPIDGGFGTTPQGTFEALIPQEGFENENFGNGQFNSTSLVEAADTPPFFHNNVAATLEDSILFYNTPEFLAADGTSIPFTPEQTTQVANFLRVINAIDNIEHSVLRLSDRYLQALSVTPTPNDVLKRISEIMIADANDAIEVLEQGNVHNSGSSSINAVSSIRSALYRINQANRTTRSNRSRARYIRRAQSRLQQSLSAMRVSS